MQLGAEAALAATQGMVVRLTTWRGGLSRIVGSTRVDNPNGRPVEQLRHGHEGDLAAFKGDHHLGEVQNFTHSCV
jgi:hypothetical protein